MPGLDQLLSEYAPDIRRLASAVLSAYPQWKVDPDRQLDDLQQEGRKRLRDIYDRIDFQNEGHRAYILSSLMWSMRNYMNKYRKDKEREKPVEDISIIYDGDHENEKLHILRKEIIDLVSEFTNTLSPKEYYIFTLKYVYGMTNIEIGIPLKKGRHKIADIIKEIISKLQEFFYNIEGWKVNTEDIKSYLEDAHLHQDVNMQQLSIVLKKDA